MKWEFERLVGKEVSDEDWELVELVYTYHPKDLTKEETATLYKVGGREIFEGLRPVAEKVKKLEDKVFELEHELRKAKEELVKFRLEHRRT